MFDGDGSNGKMRPVLEACALFGSNGDGVFCIDASGSVRYANAAAARILGRPAADLLGRKAAAIVDLDSCAAEGRLPAIPSGAVVEYFRHPVVLDDGSPASLLVLHECPERDRDGSRSALLVFHDLLTELPNQRLLAERIDFEIARASRHGDGFALHLVAIDGLGGLIEHGGHALADRVVLRLAERLRTAVRVSDTVARIAADRFAVLQVGVDGAGEVAAFARKLLVDCRQPLPVDDRRLSPAVFVGAGLYIPGCGETGLWAEAETALYRAQAGNGDGFVVAGPRPAPEALAESELASALAGAVDGEQFDLVYQPQLSFGSHAVVGVEALLRWQHPKLGEIGPAVFIPVAERYGLIDALGRWVLDRACRKIRDWIAAGVPFGRVSINLSPLQLTSEERVLTLVAIVEAYRVPWRTLEFEIAEAAWFAAGRAVVDALAALQARSARIAIDNFGTRYSPLLACRSLNANSLKLDRQCVGALEDVEAARIVRDTIALAHNLGMAVVAEGVEKPVQVGMLQRFRCDSCQGFLLGEPVGDAGLESCFFGIRPLWPASPDGENAGNRVQREIFPWAEAYETGIPQIDMQHRTLADLANRLGRSLQSAGADAAGDLLDEIADYTDYHFRCEEAFMARYGIVAAHADLHRRCHGEGLSLMRRRIAACRAGDGDPLAFCVEFVRWLGVHMLAEDKSLAEQIAAVEGGVAPVQAYRSTMLSAALECR